MNRQLLLAAVLVLFGACLVPVRELHNDGGISCATNDDCFCDEYCSNAACELVERLPCSTDVECPAPAKCVLVMRNGSSCGFKQCTLEGSGIDGGPVGGGIGGGTGGGIGGGNFGGGMGGGGTGGTTGGGAGGGGTAIGGGIGGGGNRGGGSGGGRTGGGNGGGTGMGGGNGGGRTGGGTGVGGGQGGGNGATSWVHDTISTRNSVAYSLTLNTTLNRMGIAYLEETDGGVHALSWVEISQSGSKLPSSLVAAGLQHTAGVDLAYLGGEPMVAFLGGSTPVTGWPQNDAVLAERKDGGWARTTVAAESTEAGGQIVGSVVGLWPALATSGQTTFFAWRDAHNGQFPSDWTRSDVELGERVGASGSWVRSVAYNGAITAADGGAIGLGLGHFSRMGVINGAPVIITATSDGQSAPKDVHLLIRSLNGWNRQLVMALSDITSLGFDVSPSAGAVVVASSTTPSLRRTLMTIPLIGISPQLVGTNAAGADALLSGGGTISISAIDCGGGTTACAGTYELALFTRSVTQASFTRTSLMSAAADFPTRISTFNNGKRAILYRSSTGALMLAREQ